MTRKKVYLAVQAILLVLLVVLLSAGTIRIFREGRERKAEHPLESIYSAQAVADAFAPVAPLLFAGIGMAAAGLILGVRDERQDKGVKDPRTERDLIASRVQSPDSAARSERKKQRTVRWAGWAAFLLCMVPILIYLLNKAHFPEQDVEAMIRALAAGVLPWIGAGMVCLMTAAVLEEKSILREIEALKRQLKEEKKPQETEGSKAYQTPQKSHAVLQCVVIAAAVVFLILGMRNGGMQDVLVKAINICTECVGLG